MKLKQTSVIETLISSTGDVWVDWATKPSSRSKTSNCSFKEGLSLTEQIESEKGVIEDRGKERSKDATASQLIGGRAGVVSLSYTARQWASFTQTLTHGDTHTPHRAFLSLLLLLLLLHNIWQLLFHYAPLNFPLLQLLLSWIFIDSWLVCASVRATLSHVSRLYRMIACDNKG